MFERVTVEEFSPLEPKTRNERATFAKTKRPEIKWLPILAFLHQSVVQPPDRLAFLSTMDTSETPRTSQYYIWHRGFSVGLLIRSPLGRELSASLWADEKLSSLEFSCLGDL